MVLSNALSKYICPEVYVRGIKEVRMYIYAKEPEVGSAAGDYGALDGRGSDDELKASSLCTVWFPGFRPVKPRDEHQQMVRFNNGVGNIKRRTYT